MISKEQIDRAEKEFAANAAAAFKVARDAERALENYDYSSTRRVFDPAHRDKLLAEFNDADYMAESRAWILLLIRENRPEQGV